MNLKAVTKIEICNIEDKPYHGPIPPFTFLLCGEALRCLSPSIFNRFTININLQLVEEISPWSASLPPHRDLDSHRRVEKP